MPGIKANITSAFRQLTHLGRSSKQEASTSGPAGTLRDTASPLPPRRMSGDPVAGQMAPRGRLPAETGSASKRFGPLPSVGDSQALVEIQSGTSEIVRAGLTLGDMLRLNINFTPPGSPRAESEGPIASAGHIEQSEEVNEAPAADAQHASAPKRKKVTINNLPSAPRIDLTKTPDVKIGDLPDDQLDGLMRALGLGELKEADDVMRADQLHQVALKLSNIEDRLLLKLDWKKYIAHTGVFKALPPEKQQRLLTAADVSHMAIHQSEIPGVDGGPPKQRMDIYFAGSVASGDLTQNLTTAAGGVGAVYKAAREAAELVAEAMAANPALEINRVLGTSMGGGSAQSFLAAVESQMELPNEPSLVLFDPQLLNNSQARHAVKNGKREYDFSKLRGVAITLDYQPARHKGLMNVMKGAARYKSPGLVQLRLGLKADDGRNDGVPKPDNSLLGYHDTKLFTNALRRFTKAPRPTASRPEAPLPDWYPAELRAEAALGISS